MRLIDADALHAVFVKMAEFKPNPPDEPCGAYRRLVFHISEGIRAINDAPTIDAVPVVRCKDCLWYVRSMIKQDGTLDERYKPDWCDLYRRGREETYFCADGERKDNEID